jgi:hypothetical protein
MLGNHADKFFNTPMRTTIVKGGNTAHGFRNQMPTPYEGGSRTKQVTMAGLAEDEADPTTGDPGDIWGQIQNAATKVNAVATAAQAPAVPAAKPVNWLLWGGVVVAAAVAFGAFKKA